MKNSINNLKGLLTETEKLSTLQLCQLKGGGDGDLRRDALTTTTTTSTTTAKI